MTVKLVSRGLQLPFTVITVQKEQSGAAATPPLLSARQIMSPEMSAHQREASLEKLHTHTARVQEVQLDVVSTISNLLQTASGKKFRLKIFQLLTWFQDSEATLSAIIASRLRNISIAMAP